MCLAAAAVEMISEETAAGRDTAGAGVGGCVGFFSKRGIRHQKRFALVRYLPVVFDRGLVRWRCRVKILFQRGRNPPPYCSTTEEFSGSIVILAYRVKPSARPSPRQR